MAILYRHIRLDKEEPFYIGIGATEYRAFQKSSGRTKHWHNIVKKHGYRVEIMLDNLGWGEARVKEQEFIKLYGRKDLKTGTLINLTNGGEGCLNRILSEESKRKISESNKKSGLRPELRKMRSDRMKGENNPSYGGSCRKGVKCSKEHIEKSRQTRLALHLSAWNKGISPSKEQRERQSLAISGRIYQHISQESRNLIDDLYYNKYSLRRITRITGIKRDNVVRYLRRGE